MEADDGRCRPLALYEIYWTLRELDLTLPGRCSNTSEWVGRRFIMVFMPMVWTESLNGGMDIKRGVGRGRTLVAEGEKRVIGGSHACIMEYNY